MNAKQAKKLRQQGKRYEADAQKKAILEFLMNTLKPRPWWMPKFLWNWVVSLVINL